MSRRFCVKARNADDDLRSPSTIRLRTIFTRFDDPEYAMLSVSCSRFAGEWNARFFDAWTVETAMNDLLPRSKMVVG